MFKRNREAEPRQRKEEVTFGSRETHTCRWKQRVRRRAAAEEHGNNRGHQHPAADQPQRAQMRGYQEKWLSQPERGNVASVSAAGVSICQLKFVSCTCFTVPFTEAGICTILFGRYISAVTCIWARVELVRGFLPETSCEGEGFGSWNFFRYQQLCLAMFSDINASCVAFCRVTNTVVRNVLSFFFFTRGLLVPKKNKVNSNTRTNDRALKFLPFIKNRFSLCFSGPWMRGLVQLLTLAAHCGLFVKKKKCLCYDVCTNMSPGLSLKLTYVTLN